MAPKASSTWQKCTGFRSVASATEVARRDENAAGRSEDRPLHASSAITEHEQRDVVGLGGAAGELVHCRDELVEYHVGLGAVHGVNRLEHALAAKLLVGDVACFGHAIAADDHQIT